MKMEAVEKIKNSKRNLIVEGNVLKGKTTNILFPIVDNMIEKEDSLLIIDSKEEYLNQYYEKLKEKNYNIIIINLRDMDKSDGWNPLEYPYYLYNNKEKDKAQEYLEKIGKIMFYEDSSQDPFWSLTASDLFTGVALGLFEDGSADEINLNSINQMYNGIDKKYGPTDYLTEYFKSKDPSSKPYIYAATTVLAPKDTKGSILSVARQKIRLYVSREKLSQLMSKTTFQMENIRNQKTAIFIITRDESKSLNSIAAMFIEQIYKYLLDYNNKKNFNFILDNFDSIERCNELVDMLSSSTSRNIRIMIATRSMNELINQYGSYLMNCCDTISIDNNGIKSIIDNQEEQEELDFNKVIIEESNINYPTLMNHPIKLFDLNKLVLELKKNQLMDTNPFKEPINVDDILRNIDNKIKEIEAEEKIEIEKKKNRIVSELEQFKIDK